MKQCDNTNVRKSKESILLFFFFASGGPPGALPGGSCGGLFNKFKLIIEIKYTRLKWSQDFIAKIGCKKVVIKSDHKKVQTKNLTGRYFFVPLRVTFKKINSHMVNFSFACTHAAIVKHFNARSFFFGK